MQGDGDADGYTADTRLIGILNFGSFRHTVLAGVDYQTGSTMIS